MIKGYGFEPYMMELGYGSITYLNQKKYTPFQKKVVEHLKNKKVYPKYADTDLFNFAFNKSNIISDQFKFKRFDWKKWTQLERSSFKHDTLEQEIWKVTEQATGKLNEFFLSFLDRDFTQFGVCFEQLKQLERLYSRNLGLELGPSYPEAFKEAKRQIEKAFSSGSIDAGTAWGKDPILVKSFSNHNIVFFCGTFYGLPHSLGEVCLEKDEVAGLPGVVVGSSQKEVESLLGNIN